jgi:hypothetical protein
MKKNSRIDEVRENSEHNVNKTRVIKKRTITERVKRRLFLFGTLSYNFFQILKKRKQVLDFYTLRKKFFDLYDTLIKKDISVFLTPHWETLNGQLEIYLRKRNVPFNFLRNRIIGYTMFASGESDAMKIESDYLKQIYSDKQLKKLLEEEAVGLPIITDIKHNSSHNSVRHLNHIARFTARTKINIDSIDSVLEWGGGYGNFARILLKARHSSKELTYTIIDTPLFSCIQWLYLSAVLGKDRVNIIKNDEGYLVEGKVNIVSLGFIEKINTTPDLFVSTWALSESSTYSQDYVLSKDFWSARHLLIVYQDSNKDLPEAGRLGTMIEARKKNIIKEKVTYMSWPSHYLFN